MAGKVTSQIVLICRNGELELSVNEGQVQRSQTTARGGGPGTIAVSTAGETITLGDFADVGESFVRNVDAASAVQIGPSNGGSILPLIRLEPGQYALLPFDSAATVKAKADTAEALLYIGAVDR